MKFKSMNLLFVMVNRDCNGECDRTPQPSAPEEDILVNNSHEMALLFALPECRVVMFAMLYSSI